MTTNSETLLALLIAPVILGVTLAITQLRKEMRRRRGKPYCQRGPGQVRG